jgi:hypothetical protein
MFTVYSNGDNRQSGLQRNSNTSSQLAADCYDMGCAGAAKCFLQTWRNTCIIAAQDAGEEPRLRLRENLRYDLLSM